MFGAIRSQTGTTSDFGFTGEEHDGTTGFTYLRARYLSPVLGRFVSADTVSPNAYGTQGYGLYDYVANNPTTLVDPSGNTVAAPPCSEALMRAIRDFVVLGAIGFVVEALYDYLFRGEGNDWKHDLAKAGALLALGFYAISLCLKLVWIYSVIKVLGLIAGAVRNTGAVSDPAQLLKAAADFPLLPT